MSRTRSATTRRPLVDYTGFCEPPEAKILQTVLDAVTQVYPSLRSPDKIIGKGVTGFIVLFTSNVVVKFIFISSDEYNTLDKDAGVREMIKNEQKLQNLFVKYNLAPVIFDSIIDIRHNHKQSDTYVYGLIMDPIQTTLYEALKSLDWNNVRKAQMFLCFFIESFIGSVFPTMIKNKLIHGDMHAGNVALAEPSSYTASASIEMMLIDFGRARVATIGAEHFVDLIPLIGFLSILKRTATGKNKKTQQIFYTVLIDTLVQAAKTLFSVQLDPNNIHPSGPGYRYWCRRAKNSSISNTIRLLANDHNAFEELYANSHLYPGFENISNPTRKSMRDALSEARVNCLEFEKKIA